MRYARKLAHDVWAGVTNVVTDHESALWVLAWILWVFTVMAWFGR